MGVSEEHGIDLSEAVLWEPFHSRVEEALPDVYHDRPAWAQDGGHQ